MDSDLQILLKDQVTLARAISRDEYNKQSYAPDPVIIACRLEQKRRLVINKESLPVYSTTALYFDGDPGISHDDQVTLPDGTTPSILSIHVYQDERGIAYGTEVLTA